LQVHPEVLFEVVDIVAELRQLWYDSHLLGFITLLWLCLDDQAEGLHEFHSLSVADDLDTDLPMRVFPPFILVRALLPLLLAATLHLVSGAIFVEHVDKLV
jgi:hypothetical protein